MTTGNHAKMTTFLLNLSLMMTRNQLDLLTLITSMAKTSAKPRKKRKSFLLAMLLMTTLNSKAKSSVKSQTKVTTRESLARMIMMGMTIGNPERKITRRTEKIPKRRLMMMMMLREVVEKLMKEQSD